MVFLVGVIGCVITLDPIKLSVDGYSFDFKRREFSIEHSDTALGVVAHALNPSTQH